MAKNKSFRFTTEITPETEERWRHLYNNRFIVTRRTVAKYRTMLGIPNREARRK